MKYLAFLFLVDFFLVEEGYGRSLQFSTLSFGTNSSNPSLTCGGYGGEDEDYYGDGDGDEDYSYEYDPAYDSEIGKLPDENALNKTLFGSHNNNSNNYGGYDMYNSTYGNSNSNGPKVVVFTLQRNSSSPFGSSSGGSGVNWQSLTQNVTDILRKLFGSSGSSGFSFSRAE